MLLVATDGNLDVNHPAVCLETGLITSLGRSILNVDEKVVALNMMNAGGHRCEVMGAQEFCDCGKPGIQAGVPPKLFDGI